MTLEDEIFQELSKGSGEALEQLIELYYEDIFKYCLWHMPNRSLAGFLTIINAACTLLFVSANCKSTVVSIALGILLCILPIIVCIAGRDSNFIYWIRCFLPAGGLGLQNSFTYMIQDFDFLRLGGQSFWMPYVTLAAEAVEIPVLIGLTLYTRTK